MRSPKLFLKIAAISSFALLLTSFVAYRSGALENYFNDKETALGGLHVNELDSPPAKDEPTTIMPGSKVGIWIDEPAQQDTSKKAPAKEKTGLQDNNGANKAPDQSASPKQNSKQQKNPGKEENKRVKHIMGGSKSAPVMIHREPDTVKQAPKQ